MDGISLQAMSVITERKYLGLLNVQQTAPTRSSLCLVSGAADLRMVVLTGVQMVNGEPSNPCSETLVEPKFIPPVHGDKITEPLVSELVSHNVCHPVSVAVRGCLGVEKHSGSTFYWSAIVDPKLPIVALTGK